MARGPVYTEVWHGRAQARPEPALEATLERRIVDQVAVQRPHVLAVVAPLRGLEAAAIGVLLDRLEATALGLGQRAPPAIARRVQIEGAFLAEDLARPPGRSFVVHERDHDRLTPTQRVLDDEEVVPRHALRQRVLERVADRGPARAEQRGAQQAEGDDRADAGHDEAHRGADRQADAGARRHAGDGTDGRAGAGRLA